MNEQNSVKLHALYYTFCQNTISAYLNDQIEFLFYIK